jgi:hypothetical protein
MTNVHHVSRTIISRDAVPKGAKVTAEVKQVPSYSDDELAFDTFVTITPKPKRYALPMPDGSTAETTGSMHIALRDYQGRWISSTGRYDIYGGAVKEQCTYTDADLKDAPAWVKAITPVEVKD